MTASLSLTQPHSADSTGGDSLPNTRPVRALNRRHPEAHMLFWQYRGSTTFAINDERFRTCAKQALWVPANFRHDVYVDANSVLLRIFFDADEVAIPTVLKEARIFQVDQELAGHLMGMVQSDSSILQHDCGLDQYVLNKLSRQCCTLPWPETPAARKIAELLNDDPGDPRTLHELAELVHTSPRTIERAFLTETGDTFQEWRMQSRTAKAKQLIIDGLPIDSVALHVGYSTASAFGRAFKKRTGFSPSGYFTEHVENNQRS